MMNDEQIRKWLYRRLKDIEVKPKSGGVELTFEMADKTVSLTMSKLGWFQKQPLDMQNLKSAVIREVKDQWGR